MARLPTADALWLSSRLEPPWKVRARTLEARDEAIRGTLALLSGTPNPAGRLAEQMALQARETRPGRLTGDHLVVEAVATILELNGGATMTARHLRRIASGPRTPWT